jgi:hypothetical protein
MSFIAHFTCIVPLGVHRVAARPQFRTILLNESTLQQLGLSMMDRRWLAAANARIVCHLSLLLRVDLLASLRCGGEDPCLLE